MKLGLGLGYWTRGPAPGTLNTVLEAERLGFDSVWTSEAYGSDALTPLAWWGAHTERIRLGTAIMRLSARAPTATAISVPPIASAAASPPGRTRSSPRS